MQKLLDIVFRRDRVEPEIPLCPDHHVQMRLRGKLGRPTRFSAQTEEEYTLIYFCPVEACDQTEMRKRAKTQIPVPGEAPERPAFVRRDQTRPESL